jgi:hypothetical protein
MRTKPFSGVRIITAVIISVLLVTTVCYGQETLDQVNNPAWTGGAVNFVPANKVSQIVVPSLPCLVGVEVALKTGNHGRGGDKVTLMILGGGGLLPSSISANIPEGFDGFWRFNLPGGGISVTPGKPITILLQDTGKNIFWWKYKNGNPYPAGPSSFHGSPFHDNDFFFKTYGKKNCQFFSLTVTPDPANVAKGGNQKLTVGVSRQGGFAGAVNISFLNLPSGVSAKPVTQTISGNSGISTLMVGTSATSGQYTSTVKGTFGSLTAQKNFQIKIPATTPPTPAGSCPGSKQFQGYVYVGQPGCATTNKADHPSAYLTCDATGYYCCELSTGAKTKCGTNRWTFQPDCMSYCAAAAGNCLISPLIRDGIFYGCYRTAK